MKDSTHSMRRIVIDGNAINTKEEFYFTLRKQFEPDFTMGANLDAFHDVLTSIAVPTLIVLKNKSLLYEHLGNYWGIAYQVIMDSIEENDVLGISLEYRILKQY